MSADVERARAVPFGANAVRCARRGARSGAAARAVIEALLARPTVRDVVVTEDHVCVHLAATFALVPRAVDAVAGWVAEAEHAAAAKTPDAAPRTHAVEVIYDGPDLDEVARASGLARDELVVAHATRVYEVKLVGFLPGFAYLGDLDSRLVAPRRSAPRPRVAAGSVAVGGPYTAVYPFASAGGWNLVGRAPRFDGAAAIAWELGDRVRFVSVEA